MGNCNFSYNKFTQIICPCNPCNQKNSSLISPPDLLSPNISNKNKSISRDLNFEKIEITKSKTDLNSYSAITPQNESFFDQIQIKTFTNKNKDNSTPKLNQNNTSNIIQISNNLSQNDFNRLNSKCNKDLIQIIPLNSKQKPSNKNLLDTPNNNNITMNSNSSIEDLCRHHPKSTKEVTLLVNNSIKMDSNHANYKKQKSLFQVNNIKKNMKIMLNKMKTAYKDLPNSITRLVNVNKSNEFDENLEEEGEEIEIKLEKKKKDPIEFVHTPFSNKQLHFLKWILSKEGMIIKEMDDSTIKSILNITTYMKVQKNVTLFSNENLWENKFYIVEKGKLEYLIDGVKFYLLKYESIGTKAIRLHCKESCKLSSVNNSSLFCIPIERYKTIVEDFVNKDKQEKLSILKHNYFFKYLDPKILESLSFTIVKHTIKDRTTLITEDNISTSFFLIISGTVFCLKKNSTRIKLEENDLFGDLSLFGELKSTYTYIANSDTILLEINNEDFFESLGESPIYNLSYNIFQCAIENSEIINKYLLGERLLNIFKEFTINYYKEGETVYNFQSKKIFIPLSGFLYKKDKQTEAKKKVNMNDMYELLDSNINVTGNIRSRFAINKSKNLIIQYNQKNNGVRNGEFFLDSILSNIDDNTVISSEDCVILEANWDCVIKKLHPLNNKKESMYDRIKILKNIKKISEHLSELKLFIISDELKIQKYKDNTTILKNGPISNYIYIIKSGTVKMIRSGTNIEFQEFKHGNFFGEYPSECALIGNIGNTESTQGDNFIQKNKNYNSCLNNNLNNNINFQFAKKKGNNDSCINTPNEHNIFNFVSKGPVECLTLDVNDYKYILEDSNDSILNPLKNLFIQKDKSITLQKLFFVKEIGCGTYGKVYLVHNQKNFYAMKTAVIQAMCNNKMICQYYINEKKIMQKLNHPFIVKLYNTFKTTELIFFLMEYVSGVTLRQYIDERLELNKSKSQNNNYNNVNSQIKLTSQLRNPNEIIFYGGSIFIVLNYLQKMRIIHRDLKPENIMIETNGYIKLIDFGVSKNLGSKDSTKTLIGTPHYMAPEIISGKHYSFPADYWSIGVILYELFYGALPFGVDASSSKQIFEEITEKKLVFPSDPRNKNINLLMKGLLQKNPNKRLCSFNQIKETDFFSQVNFDDISEMKMTPVYLPDKTLNEDLFKTKVSSFYNYVINRLDFNEINFSNISEQIAERNDFLVDF